MFGDIFTNNELEKYIAVFGTLFNNISIKRDGGTDPSDTQVIKVPIAYGPREKFLARDTADPELDRGYSVQLPRMAFEITGFQYDGSRKRPTTGQWVAPTTRSQKISYNTMYNPVPYNINIRLSILANRTADAARITNQILPYFTPDWTVTVHPVDQMPDYSIDVPINIKGNVLEETYEGLVADRRVIIWTLDFEMRVEFFAPIREAKLIKVAKVNLYADQKGVFPKYPDERVQVQPGLTANGQPTSDESQSIPVFQIDETDNYGYVVKITSVEDGPITD